MSLKHHAALLCDNIEQKLVAAKEENFERYLETFVCNQTAIIRKNKISSYLSKVIPILRTVVKETAKPFEIFLLGKDKLPHIDMPFGSDYLHFIKSEKY